MKTTAMQRMVAGSRIHKAPRMGATGENDPKHKSAQLFGELSLCHYVSRVYCTPSNETYFLGGDGGAVTASLPAKISIAGFMLRH